VAGPNDAPGVVTLVVVGQLLDREGLARRIDVLGRTRAWATRPGELRRTQPLEVPVNVDHVGAAVGRVLDLERNASGLWAVAEVTRNLPMLFGRAPLYFSAETTAVRDGVDHTDVEVVGVALVERSAQTGLSPVEVYVGDLRSRHGWAVSPLLRRRLDRAYERRIAVECRSAGGLVLHDEGPLATSSARHRDVDPVDDRPPPGRLRFSKPYHGILRVS
jgi:hypothetical protein